MKHVNLYEHYFYGPEDGNAQSGASTPTNPLDMTPKKFRNELVRSAKDKLASLSPSTWNELGEIIEKIDLLCGKYSIGWSSIMRNSSKISSYVHEMGVIEYFKSMLEEMLDQTIFANIKRGKNWDIGPAFRGQYK